MVLNEHHADIQPMYDAIPYYWDMCQYEETVRKHRFFYFIHCIVTAVLNRIER